VSIDFIPNSSVLMGLNMPFAQNVSGGTLMGWVELDALPASGTDSFNSISINNGGAGTASSRFNMDVQSNGAIRAGYRTGDGGAFQTVSSAAGVAVVGERAHFSVTVDLPTGAVVIYKDGVQVATGTGATAAAWPDTTSDNSRIASNDQSNGEFVDGRIEDYRLYHRVLSQEEIAAIATGNGQDGIVDTMVFRWEMHGEREAVAPETLGTETGGNEVGTEASDQIGIAGSGDVLDVSNNKYIGLGEEPTNTPLRHFRFTRSVRRTA